MKRDSISSVLEEYEIQPIEAAKHVANARHFLTCLRDKLGIRHQWPELEEAVTELEIALGMLTSETGGML